MSGVYHLDFTHQTVEPERRENSLHWRTGKDLTFHQALEMFWSMSRSPVTQH